ncbi:MAG: DMT family transporter [Alphaproteobacteria bacterium]|nr:DMT family transporter [Alphaproteobacteria bacterium]
MTATPAPDLRLPLAMLLVGGIAWGGIFTVNKMAAAAGIPPVAYAFWPVLCAGIGATAVALIVDRRLGLSRDHLVFYFFSGIANIGFGMIILAYVAARLPAGVVTLVMPVSPTMTYVFALFFGIDRIRWKSVLGIAFGVVGVLTLTVPDLSLPEPDMAAWFFLALLAPLGFATGNIYVVLKRPPQASSVGLAAGLALGAAVFMLPAYLVAGEGFHPFAASGEALQALGLSACVHGIVLALFFEIVRRAGPVFFSQLGYIAIIAGLAWGVIVFSETYSTWVWSAAVLLLIGLYLVNAGTRESLRERA